MEFFHIGVQFCVGEPVDDTPMFHHVMAIGKRRGEAEILHDQEYSESLRLERAYCIADLLDDDRHEPFGRFVQEKKARAGAQDTPDR